MGRKTRAAWLLLISTALVGIPLNADFYVKAPEFNSGDGAGGYDLYKPPWYPYNIEEAEKYTVDEEGVLVERTEEEFGLLEYGKRKVTKAERIKTALKKLDDKLIFEKVLPSPRALVWEFYAHAPFMAYDLAKGNWQSTLTFVGGNAPKYGGPPAIPTVNRIVIDATVFATICGWEYSLAGQMAGVKKWEGVCVPNLREIAVFLTMEGVAALKTAVLLVERDVKKKFFNPGHAYLKPLGKKDHGLDAARWKKAVVEPIWNKKHEPGPKDHSGWKQAVESLVVSDLRAARVPEREFMRLRDVPELSEPILLERLKSGKADLLEKRNLASILRAFSSPRAAKALHGLARDKDNITALRAVNSLSRHPHGKLRSIIESWLKSDDDVRRSKAILLVGRSGDEKLSKRIHEMYDKAEDDFEKELILRSLMRLRYEPALPLFEKESTNEFSPINYTANLALMVMDKLPEGRVMKMIDEAFRRRDAAPGSSTLVSLAYLLRLDMIKWMASTDMKKPRRRLWRYIQDFKDLGHGSEVGGVPHILAYGLTQMKFGDDVIGKGEAVKILNGLAARQSVQAQIRLAALSRLYELDAGKCLKRCNIVIERFLKGREVGTTIGNRFVVDERDLLEAAVQIVFLDDPKNPSLVTKIMTNPNIGGDIKSGLLENIYNHERKLALKIVRKNIGYYSKQADMKAEDRQYLARLLRYTGILNDQSTMKDVLKLMGKHPDEWLRFLSLYSLRLSLDSDEYGNVIDGSGQERSRTRTRFQELIRKQPR